MAAIKGAGNNTVTYNANAITNYTNQTDLQATIAELEATHLGSTAMQTDPGLASWQLQIGGDWNSTIDGFLGPDALESVRRTTVIGFSDGSETVTYTWTAAGDVGGFITNYQVQSTAQGKLAWTATLRLSGNPMRGVA